MIRQASEDVLAEAGQHIVGQGPAVATGDGDGRARFNARVLACAQALYGVSAMVVFTLGGIVGHTLADDKSLSTLPISVMLFGTAIATAPASLLMQRIGRRSGFLLGTGFGLTGALLAAYAVIAQDFWLFCLGTHLSGYYQAFAQYYRFAAADTASDRFAPRAISWVLAGGVVAAFMGPVVIARSKDALAPAFYAGSFIAVAAITLAAMVVLALIDIPRVTASANGEGGTARPLLVVLRNRRLLAAIAAGMISYGMMSLVMTATPLAMVACDLSVGDAADTIRWHVVAMYAPSFFTGALIARFGRERIVIVGLLLLAGCALVALSGVSLAQFTLALVLLGLGWNLGFIGATAIVAECYRPVERGKVQAFNDFMVFGFVSLSSFMSGKLLAIGGWSAVPGVVIPAVGLALLLIFLLARKPATAHHIPQ